MGEVAITYEDRLTRVGPALSRCKMWQSRRAISFFVPIAFRLPKTLKTIGRGKGVRERWRNYCNNATIRGEIWRRLRYKCHLVGLRFQTCPPRGTSHTCPHCGKPAKTYRAPDQRSEDVRWGRWMWCEACGFNGDQDYCASLNIARLGVAYLLQMKHLGKANIGQFNF